MSNLLKLRAVDAEDVQIVSAVLQDAIVPICDIVWQPEPRRFVMVAQRLRREATDAAAPERICCALDLQGVTQAQLHGLSLQEPARMLELLMLGVEGDTLHLIFADDARIRLKLSAWTLRIEDFGAPWPAAHQPQHDLTR